jgi:prolipoprotein diacylglyceryltransferase
MSFLPDWMWAYNYPNNVLGVDMIQYFEDKGYTSLTGYAFPTPIYEIIMSVIIFAFLWGMRKRWTVPGMIIAVYLILTGIERLLIEKIRINNEYDILGGITQAEIISIVMITVGIYGVYKLPKLGNSLIS